MTASGSTLVAASIHVELGSTIVTNAVLPEALLEELLDAPVVAPAPVLAPDPVLAPLLLDELLDEPEVEPTVPFTERTRPPTGAVSVVAATLASASVSDSCAWMSDAWAA